MTPSFLAHRTALVTGAAQGIGRAIATRLAAAGEHVVLHDLPGSAHVDEASRRCARRARATPASSAPTCAPAIASTRRHGGIDILVNNAGIQATAPIVDITVTSTNVEPTRSCGPGRPRRLRDRP